MNEQDEIDAIYILSLLIKVSFHLYYTNILESEGKTNVKVWLKKSFH